MTLCVWRVWLALFEYSCFSLVTWLLPFILSAENCGDAITYSGVDFPRAVNIYIIGEQGPTDYTGYGFAPGAWDDVTYGHIGLTWNTFSTGRPAEEEINES